MEPEEHSKSPLRMKASTSKSFNKKKDKLQKRRSNSSFSRYEGRWKGILWKAVTNRGSKAAKWYSIYQLVKSAHWKNRKEVN